MKSPSWRFLLGAAFLVLAIDVILALPNVIGKQVEWQTVYYALASLAASLVFAAIVEVRMEGLDRKLDKLLKAHSKEG